MLAPAPVILVLLPLIFNQIRRNQALRHLINAPKDVTLDSDPYEHENEDLNECKALESSLWEIETLRRHFMPEVKRAANQITKSLGQGFPSGKFMFASHTTPPPPPCDAPQCLQ